MIAAVVALSLAVAAATGGLIMLAVKALSAEKRCGDSRAHEADIQVRLEMAIANIHTTNLRADAEKERADALDNALAHAAVTGPVDGAFDRLLQTWRAARPGAAAGAGAAEVHHESAEAGATKAAGSDELMRPGD